MFEGPMTSAKIDTEHIFYERNKSEDLIPTENTKDKITLLHNASDEMKVMYK